ncbi:hypothetical protein UFOVP1470_53 [uncultured Caudovirales phage]|uniref:Uncharacterized protein n=1 Tax=uncultured Caudovirales phage TaxID=2100421 RepID=A0A6J5QBL0_9CAUD|nr:hypothetical protein UFOVP939_26 [uncultured Caudovirales phage]CAB4178595.1 hypothetical protein UFOVP1018_51 [uncultured Caudovirales phage]CAB4184329.1 hypothetical protein UFOVP1105_52 [uncultured Caudovirales phage]CAB4202859.1 hypothetical protein UFOVP1372_42 [uncultured Caudovirales phage]CAB4215062.1 hypothetical protein UFOVP1470_53 [uncultured Caudovirales phage]
MTSNIIRIQDLVDSRALKSKELVFYNERLDELNIKLGVIQREIVITKFIIDAIGREQILDLKDFTK